MVGPVESIESFQRRISVMGQSVLVNSNTAFGANIDPHLLSDLTVGDVAQVSGFTTASGEIFATRVEHAPDNSKYQLIGTVTELDAGNFTFQINNLN